MKPNPYMLDTPAVVSFSGGRTSGLMLWNILQAFGGSLPPDVRVIFCNTGKERPETLDFVERCSLEWDVPITWLEYRRDHSRPVVIDGRNGQPAMGQHSYQVVNYATASRDGKPFNDLLDVMAAFRLQKGESPVLPNVVQRFCTGEMKQRTAGRYIVSQGLNLSEVTDAIGLRADEPRRLAKLAARKTRSLDPWECGDVVAPLGLDGVTEPDVMKFWSSQSFDLGLRQYEGNCDLCFLKSRGKRQTIMRNRPDLAEWWIDQENRTGQKFRKDEPSYRSLLAKALEPTLFDNIEEPDELGIACHCTD